MLAAHTAFRPTACYLCVCVQGADAATTIRSEMTSSLREAYHQSYSLIDPPLFSHCTVDGRPCLKEDEKVAEDLREGAPCISGSTAMSHIQPNAGCA